MVFEMMLSGLCAFVRASCKIKHARFLHVLMLNHRTHEPKLVVSSLYVQPIAKGEDPAAFSPDTVLDLPSGEQLFIWNLRGYRLDFEEPLTIGIREGTRERHVRMPDLADGAKKNQPSDFSWVPELCKAMGVDEAEEAKIVADPAALDESMPPGYVAARLAKLTVSPSDTNPENWVEAVIDSDSMERVFTFHDGYQQVLADRVKLTVNASEPPRLLLHSYVAGKATKTIRLRQLPFEEKVGVSVSNLPSSVEAFIKGDALDHFMAFYDVVPGVPLDKRRLLPREARGMSAEPVKCTLCSVCGGP